MGHWRLDFKVIPTDPISNGEWRHVVAVITKIADQSYETTIYFDNVPTVVGVTGVTMNTAIDPGNPDFRIGARNTFTNNTDGIISNMFEGDLDEVRVYNRAISAAEVALLYAHKTPLSVSDVDKIADFQVFPTITSDILEVKSKVQLKELSIVNLNGTTIRSIKANEAINVSSLSSGLYFIVGQSDNGISTVKFVKK